MVFVTLKSILKFQYTLFIGIIYIILLDVEVYHAHLHGCNIPKIEERGISVKQLRQLYYEIQCKCENKELKNKQGLVLLEPEKVTIYDICDNIIKKRTEKKELSYVEQIATGPQPPTIFVSHWWGGPICGMVNCLEQYILDHNLSEDNDFFWICVSVLSSVTMDHREVFINYVYCIIICLGLCKQST